MIRRNTILLASLLVTLVVPAVAHADFGIAPGSFSIRALNRDGTVDTLAGSHPDSFTVHFELNGAQGGHTEGGRLRNVLVKLPPGFIGNPRVVPQCGQRDFEKESCPPDTQVGVLHATVQALGEIVAPVYNLIPPPGTASELAVDRLEFISRQLVSVLSEEYYSIGVGAQNAPFEISAVTETIWGVPADPEHDNERGNFAFDNPKITSSSSAPLLPYLTLPASCGSAPKAVIEVDSVQEPARYVSETAETRDAGGNPAPMTGCDVVPFNPSASLTPTSSSASSATGLSVQLTLPESSLLNPKEGAIAETESREATVTLPAGMTVNPSVAVGIGVCSEAQYHAEQVETPTGTGCPDASKIGSIVARSPLIEEQVEGALYLAEPYANPFKTLIAMYIVARAKERGVIVKQAGSVSLDPNTGQISATFQHLPPLPYSSLEVKLREGVRAPLVTPTTCGTYQSQAKLTPFSAENDSQAKTILSDFQVRGGANGAACPSGGAPPFAPTLTAGMVNNAAGHFSPLYLHIERQDGEQEITGFSTLLPPGLSGDLTGVPFCAEAAIQHAREQTGAEAETSPACPVASKIGHSVAEAGVGSVLAQAPGNLYLAGSFEGAPFSVVSVTAAKVGPFDLGTVVVRLPLNIDPTTAQVSIPSGPADQIPHIIKGVVIHLRAISVWVDRSSFTLNPTNCQPMSLTSTIDGAGLNVASATDDTRAGSGSRFQAAECANLGFKPTFNVTTNSKTSRKNGASLHVKLTYPKTPQGTQANIHTVKVNLPKQLPSRLTTLQKACTAAQFETNPAGCPLASRVGQAIATTPILPVPIAGPAYFVSHGGAKFPELIIVLQGYGITIDLHGETFINKAGITSSTFHTIPDQPVTSFELTLPQGPNSALAANGNLCTTKLTMPTQFTGQNGATIKQNTPITTTGCPKKKTNHKTKKARKAGAHHQHTTHNKKK